jgi:hypothetical protein
MTQALRPMLAKPLIILFCFALLFEGSMVSQAFAFSRPLPTKPLVPRYGGPYGATDVYPAVTLQTFCIPGWNSTTDQGGYAENYTATNGSQNCAQATWNLGGAAYYYCNIYLWVPSSYADEPNLGVGIYSGNSRIAVLHINEQNYTDQWAELPGDTNQASVTMLRLSNNTGDYGYYIGIGVNTHSLHIHCG